MSEIIVKKDEALIVKMWRDRGRCRSDAVMTVTVTNKEQDIDSINYLLRELEEFHFDNSVNIYSIHVQQENNHKKDITEELAEHAISREDFVSGPNNHDYVLNSEAYEAFMHRDPYYYYDANAEHGLTALDLGLTTGVRY